MQTIKTDILIIGAGIMGMALARELLARNPALSLVLIDKEEDVARHGSGRNSGVLHAGFYYTADSLKARFTREGNQAMRTFCRENNLLVNECGKVVVATREEELEALFELERRGRCNGVEVTLVDEQELAEIEPNARTVQKALHSPTTASVDPIQVCSCLRDLLRRQGAVFYFKEGYRSRKGDHAVETSGALVIEFGRLINAAGLYADRIARDFGLGMQYRIMPFKGVYLECSGQIPPVRTNVYPVPNLRNPFLGVHFTLTGKGLVKIGPTAIPALWRENYQGLEGFRLDEFVEIVGQEARLFWADSFGFRALALEEMKKFRQSFLIASAARLVRHLEPEQFRHWTRPGIRAQLLDVAKMSLVQDFLVEADQNSVHVLNAVSPAFTCAFPFAAWIVEEYGLGVKQAEGKAG
ncbi:MAG: FAD-dependent oxidoreductase [Deltaproteobacteria bacterium RIFOXYD12_FULL_55_16]|nr:MAG: FAD-dependent oxidoreductase [Deltaproteobacteria bacterium RIFOXYD12_FULL_55_16]